ncbi:hypothetical protein DS745_23380 [Anaerobacillus alkaliphilus]|uniref:Uncharacterized protein n=1 Tax=Anaerobacillus alkaliphilus TaxID=1548597 RepID=A0A4Q0VNI9_9BACI|nr:hypothetical protein [Anaerobacillus alkaliphilus]RXI96644.1 hypothetical protein DS745_23380 [Anaerobacillus alkaliphilus]
MKKKIIISNRSKIHMEVHQNDFLFDWQEMLESYEQGGYFNHLSKQSEKLIINAPEPIGISSLINTDENSEIVYAKRKERNIYTRFVKNRKGSITNSFVVILSRSRNNNNQYLLVTMFPGTGAYKEPEDPNILTKRELIESLLFWENHALVFDESTIDYTTITPVCPYKDLYLGLPLNNFRRLFKG